MIIFFFFFFFFLFFFGLFRRLFWFFFFFVFFPFFLSFFFFFFFALLFWRTLGDIARFSSSFFSVPFPAHPAFPLPPRYFTIVFHSSPKTLCFTWRNWE